MLGYIVRRVAYMIITLITISSFSFFLIELPPGDWLTSYVMRLAVEENINITEASEDTELTRLRERYALGKPFYAKYWKWITSLLLHNDWGFSLEYRKQVRELIFERLGLTMVLSGTTMVFSMGLSIAVGVYSATHQYTTADYVVNIIGFLGAAVPGFLLALVVMWLAYSMLGMEVGGLFSLDMVNAPWSWAKFVDMLKHLWIPVIVLAVGSTASGIRTTRANLLDELSRPYVQTARAKGLKERKLLWKYPVRVALNPFFSTVGWQLTNLISGGTLVSQVLSLQTTGPMYITALRNQDMYLAGSFLLMLSVMTVIGTLLSDIILAVIDPRILLR